MACLAPGGIWFYSFWCRQRQSQCQSFRCPWWSMELSPFFSKTVVWFANFKNWQREFLGEGQDGIIKSNKKLRLAVIVSANYRTCLWWFLPPALPLFNHTRTMRGQEKWASWKKISHHGRRSCMVVIWGREGSDLKGIFKWYVYLSLKYLRRKFVSWEWEGFSSNNHQWEFYKTTYNMSKGLIINQHPGKGSHLWGKHTIFSLIS